MKQLCVTIYVDPANAVRHGKTKVGEVSMTLTDDDVISLTAEQRECLARHVGREARWGDPLHVDAPPVSEANLATLMALLDVRIAREAKHEREVAEEAARKRRHVEDVIERMKHCNPAEFWVISPVLASQRKGYMEGISLSEPEADTWLATLAGRESEAYAWHAEHEREREEVLAESRRRDEERRAAEERERLHNRAKVRQFIIELKKARGSENGLDPTLLDWFDSLATAHDARGYMREQLERLCIFRGIRVITLDPDCRYGAIIEPITILDAFKRKREIEACLRPVLDSLPVDEWSVVSQVFFRPSKDGDSEYDIDEDGEVAERGYFRIVVSVGGVTVSVWTE